MRLFRLYFLVALFAPLVADAQQMDIKGATFDLVLNESDMTAALRNAKYVVDDREFPMRAQKRKFKDFVDERVKTGNIVHC